MDHYYRENAFSPNEMRPRDSDYYGDLEYISGLVTQKFHGMSKKEYLTWRTHWKETYADISDRIRWLKKYPKDMLRAEKENLIEGLSLPNINNDMGNSQSDLKAYQKLANTLLNAREFAKNVRRKETEQIQG